ncbi:MAG TPA: asparagine synthase (glutamine-hydrolyzing) [Thermoanaerobaculia bacterium]|nr:asparagine synthase (glutamine-hydrolyzing) [Thermoanaerobaculia bacterium]
MCGINAIFAFHPSAPTVDEEELLRTRECMRLRGPDACGSWISDDRRAGLAHRRLSIIDLDERANQPMHAREGDMSIVFNGEIYNYRELRDELSAAGETFDTTSDTEVLLRMYRREGAAMLPKLRGMFAICIWDARTRSMFLARDPYGIKPLYYANDGATLRVASQVKALLAGGGVSTARDPAGIAGFLLRGSVPEPFTMYWSIRALPAGSWMTATPAGATEPVTYFSIASVLRDAVHSRSMSQKRREEIIRDAVTESVRYHLVSDVPVGAFLSSGRDSSTVVALAAETGTPMRSVTLRFDEYAGTPKDEAPLAEVVARQYGTQHATWTLTAERFREELPNALAAMDQPSIDGLNSYFVCKAASELGWKVALSGTGGDELFGGYSTFRNIPRFVRTFRIFRHLPSAAHAFQRAYERVRPADSAERSPKTAHALKYVHSYEGAYLMKRGLFLPEELPSLVGDETAKQGLARLSILDSIRQAMTPDPGTPFARVAALESALFMRNQLLRDIDWASMAHSLEVRVPLVDAFLLRKVAPAVFTTTRRDGKELLARSPRTPLPGAIMTRRKTGFTLPITDWLEREHTEVPHSFGMRPWALFLYHHNLAG